MAEKNDEANTTGQIDHGIRSNDQPSQGGRNGQSSAGRTA